MELINKIHEIAEIMTVYDQQELSAKKDLDKNVEKNKSTHEVIQTRIKNERDEALKNAQTRKGAWEKELESADNRMNDLERSYQDQIRQACYPMDHRNEDPATCLKTMTNVHEPSFQNGDNDELIQLIDLPQEIMTRYKEDRNKLKQEFLRQFNQEMAYAQKLYSTKSAEEEQRYLQVQQNDKELLWNKRIELQDWLQKTFDNRFRSQEIKAQFEKDIETIPTHDNYVPPQDFPQKVWFGYAGYDVTEDLVDENKRKTITTSCGYMLSKENRQSFLKFPIGYSLTDSHFSTMFEFNSATREEMTKHMQSLVLRLMMSMPCNKAWLTMIDPIELGKTFALFAPWGDIEERVIDTRIWHDEARIEERLQNIIDHTSDVNFRCLQGRYKNIIEYNKSAGKNAEPLRFLVIMDFPRRFSTASLEKLESIVTNGPTTGVFALIAADVDAMAECMDPIADRIRKKMNLFSLQNGKLYLPERVIKRQLRFLPMICSDDPKAPLTVSKIGEGIQQAERIVIRREDVYNSSSTMMSLDASNGISVPIGLEGANKQVILRLGGVSEGGRARSYHAMVGGAIGSGKSSMLHNIVMGILTNYNPNEVQVYLVDLKNGVEFKRYARHMALANLRVVAIDAEKEFALAILKGLEFEQFQRGQRFREEGVSRIEEYNRKMREENKPDRVIPRLVVIMDEVQGLFDKAEDPITQECTKIIETLILMGGSAFGIQMILATQDWSNVKGLGESIYNNIGVRIVLKSNRESAEKILDADNEAISRLATMDAGQAIFNEYTGHKDYNHEFRGILIPDDEVEKTLANLIKMQQEDQSIHKPSMQRLLSSDIQDHDSHPLNQFINSGSPLQNRSLSYRLYLGESLGMRNTYSLSLAARNGSNLLLVGNNERTASTLCGFAAMSLILEAIRLEGTIENPLITLFDFSSEGGYYSYEQKNLLKYLTELMPNAFRIFSSSEVLDGMQILEKDLEQMDDMPHHFVMIFGLNRARRLTEGNAYTQKPRENLVRMLHDGPGKGLNFIVWANSPSGFQQNYSDAISEFENRLIFEETEEELYPFFVSDKKPGNADQRNAIAFNLDGDNQTIKLYTRPTDKWLDKFSSASKKYFS